MCFLLFLFTLESCLIGCSDLMMRKTSSWFLLLMLLLLFILPSRSHSLSARSRAVEENLVEDEIAIGSSDLPLKRISEQFSLQALLDTTEWQIHFHLPYSQSYRSFHLLLFSSDLADTDSYRRTRRKEESGFDDVRLFCTSLGVYGDVHRVKILFNKKDSALIQFATPQQAAIGRFGEGLPKFLLIGLI